MSTVSEMSSTAARRIPIPVELVLVAISILITLVVVSDPTWTLWTLAVVSLASAAIILGFDYLDPLIIFILPWVGIDVFANMDISKYARPLSKTTHGILLAVLVVAVAARFFGRRVGEAKGRKWLKCSVNRTVFNGAVLIFLIFTLFNVAVAGYIPLIRGIQTGDTGYLGFGIHGVFGLYNAFANALAVSSFFLYLKRGDKRFLLVYFAVLLAFVLFVTRQNVLSVIVESFAVYCLVRGKVRRRTLVIGISVVLILFALAGNWRSGDIKKIAGVRDEYAWVPDPVIWVYGYSYFTVLNLDNVISDPRLPAYDGSSLFGLLPSFLRPKVTYTSQNREIGQFTVYSYIAPIYADVGIGGVILFTFLVCLWGARSYERARKDGSFYCVVKYSVLFYCLLFSFFVNYWLYLPIIAQIPILKAFSTYGFTPDGTA